MKKLFLLLILLIIPTTVFAISSLNDLEYGKFDNSGAVKSVPKAVSSTVLTSDGTIKASSGTLYALLISFNGTTAGDKIDIKNSIDGTGASVITVISTGANENVSFSPAVGVFFSTGIYCDITTTTGTATVTAVYE